MCSTFGAIGQPGKSVYVGTTTVLPLKAKPVVLRSKYILVEVLQELLYPLTKEPVGNSWVLDHSTATGTSVIWVVRTDQMCKLRPLEIGSTVGEEHRGQSQRINHGYQPTALSHLVGTGASE